MTGARPLPDRQPGRGWGRAVAGRLAPAYRERDLRLTVGYLHERPGVRAELEAAGAAVLSLDGPGGHGRGRPPARRLLAATRPDLVHTTTLFEADLVGRVAAGRVPVVSSLVNDAYGATQAGAPGSGAGSWGGPAARRGQRPPGGPLPPSPATWPS